MNKNGYTIRLERSEEHRDVEALVREAFPPKEKLKLPGQIIG